MLCVAKKILICVSLSAVFGILNAIGKSILGVSFYESAGRTFADAENIEVAVKGFHPIDHHSCMHANIEYWKEYIEPRIKK